MGLSLNSDEVQRNLALLPVADNVSVLCASKHLTLLSRELSMNVNMESLKQGLLEENMAFLLPSTQTDS